MPAKVRFLEHDCFDPMWHGYHGHRARFTQVGRQAGVRRVCSCARFRQHIENTECLLMRDAVAHVEAIVPVVYCSYKLAADVVINLLLFL